MTNNDPSPVVEGLLPCPLCQAQPKRNGRLGVGGVLCAGDSKTVGMIHRFQTYGADQAEADAAWNRTALRTPMPARVREGPYMRGEVTCAVCDGGPANHCACSCPDGPVPPAMTNEVDKLEQLLTMLWESVPIHIRRNNDKDYRQALKALASLLPARVEQENTERLRQALNKIADLGSCAGGKTPAHKLFQQAIDIATGAL